MKPQIGQTTTKDGVDIAYWRIGEGMPLVQMPILGFSHAALEWESTLYRPWYRALSASRMLVRYDSRGSGLSDPHVADYSLEGHIRDLEAVLGAIGQERCALMGVIPSCPVAVAYAVRHPDRVSHLVLLSGWARASDYYESARGVALRAALDADWELYTETLAGVALLWRDGQESHELAELFRQCVSQDGARAILSAQGKFDVTHLLQQVTTPTLVLHPMESRFVPVDIAKRLAFQIPGARLLLLEEQGLLPFLRDANAVLGAVNDFLGRGEGRQRGLTGRELEVLRLVTEGKRNREIAAELGISTNTVDRHVSNILAKTGTGNRVEVAAYAARAGLA